MLEINKNCKVFAKTIEDEALRQIKELAECQAYKGNKIRIMPDTHAGAGCTIGTTMVITDKITPNLVGVDIGCGMLCVSLKEPITDFAAFDKHLREVMPSGFSIHDTPVCDVDLWTKRLNGMRCREAFDMDYALRSLGSLGGGNHFVEINEDKDGKQWLVIHCGSRNLGVKVANHYQKVAEKMCAKPEGLDGIIAKLKAEGREREIADTIKSLKKVPKDLAYVSGKAFDDYIHDMRICQEYASHNRMLIAERLLGVREFDHFQTIHNYIDCDNMILRKGAVSAQLGERLIIPMNMRDGSLICVGKGNGDWNNSAPHGAGRLMSRRKAKETLSLADFERSMDGIFTTSVCQDTIDEAPMAYKPTEEIVECVKDSVDIVDIIKPVYNFKAAEK